MTGARACKGGNFGVPWSAWSPPWTHQNLQNVQKQGMTFACYRQGCVQAAAASSPRLLVSLTVPSNLCALVYCEGHTLNSQNLAGPARVDKHTSLHSVEGI